jgi:hypothetical protein
MDAGWSPVTTRARGPRCAYCDERIPVSCRSLSVYCGKRCRQAAFRVRKAMATMRARELRARTPLRMAYADPPYPRKARRYYGREPDFAGEVNHRALIKRLERDFDGWALSTGAYALRELLPLCPKGVRVCVWVKPHHPHPKTRGPHNAWEAVIVQPGRRLRPGVRDWLLVAPPHTRHRLAGRKPIDFCVWLFALLGLLPGDALVDLFPGSGAVSHAWREAGRIRRVGASGDDPRPTRRAEVLRDGSRGGRRRELGATDGARGAT